jgi:hypothetical protein
VTATYLHLSSEANTKCSDNVQEPNNDVYKKALEMTHQAPQLHAELQKQIQASQVRNLLIFPSPAESA